MAEPFQRAGRRAASIACCLLACHAWAFELLSTLLHACDEHIA